MNWITTNIRFPEDLYIELKIQAAKQKKSVAALIREKLLEKKSAKKKASALGRQLKRISRSIAKENKGINFTKGIIEMRYEQ